MSHACSLREVPSVRGGGAAVSVPGAERRGVCARRLLGGGARTIRRRRARPRTACADALAAALRRRTRSRRRSPSCAACVRSAMRRWPAPTPKIVPLKPVPLQTLVVNVTNQCNLACTYCYEYGEDKIVDTENGKQPKFMTEETARESVDFMLRESRDNPTAHMTFFGGETLMNFPVLKSTIAYARRARGGSGQGDRLQPDDQRDAAAPGRHRVPRREPRRRDDLDRRARGDAGQVPRLQERQRQLRRRGAEDQGAAGAASHAARSARA